MSFAMIFIIIFYISLSLLSSNAIAQSLVLQDEDPCLDSGFNISQWAVDNSIRPNYIQATTEKKPIVAQRILTAPRTSETGQSYSIELNQTSVLYMTGVSTDLLEAQISKRGFPEDLPRSLSDGYNSAILLGERTTFKFSGRIETHNGATNVYATGVGTTAVLEDPRLYSTGPGAIGLFSVRGASLNVTDFRHCSGGFRSPTLAGSNMNSRGGIAHTKGPGSPLIYSLGRITAYDLNGWAQESPAIIMEGPQYLHLNSCRITSDRMSGVLFFDWSVASRHGTGTLDTTSLDLTVSEGPAFHLATFSANIKLNAAKIKNPSGILLLADTNTVSRDLERIDNLLWSADPISSNSSLTVMSSDAISGDIVTQSGCTVFMRLLTNTSWTGGATASLVNDRGGLTIQIDETSIWTVTKNSFVRGLSIMGGDLDQIVGQNFTVTYDRAAPESSWLQGRTHDLSQGGKLVPWK
ncbi:hypothetical protein CkaCkLH20_08254 [Colletotrichum karsti]|uniref:Uncharacterized protein n=1 Tax=Colletotrichum karsti TaxID=1095194 RepID=A0A9P6I3H2_9PEZI|nr:uncharacterized protein CkaCkLH20_08254 [Colletotrichum karsti]KAF9874271.1 hypothetical protein CkaCkLH20_08254 [Colletotrichum karsti]